MEQPQGRTYRPARERREEVLERAIALFAEHGAETSLRALADSLGLSHAALRYHFPSRDDLLIAVYRAHEASEKGRDGDPPDVSAVEVMENSALRNRSVPGLVELYATLTTDALREERHPATHAFIRDRFSRVRADLAEHIRADQAAGRLDPAIDADDAAALIAAASDGLQLQWLLDPDAVDVPRVLTLLERIFPARAERPAD
ncbi:helix-turn-helix transcriptional regulator [Propioniciclava coleopterorum]|uniref:Helix-turn-helix transcriptional regulator n=1 Tax=Propioniciclava coleopterorum TaxID=2714937 RepID=A0A6G7Y402_9ACTN|nr:helix-turn-helix domain-containing protein [Propioniciclava coleopterorum]QIK71550.1 helix-turn-helix transcriptional regulator [Propioniciclava coleopterorum]